MTCWLSASQVSTHLRQGPLESLDPHTPRGETKSSLTASQTSYLGCSFWNTACSGKCIEQLRLESHSETHVRRIFEAGLPLAIGVAGCRAPFAAWLGRFRKNGLVDCTRGAATSASFCSFSPVFAGEAAEAAEVADFVSALAAASTAGALGALGALGGSAVDNVGVLASVCFPSNSPGRNRGGADGADGAAGAGGAGGTPRLSILLIQSEVISSASLYCLALSASLHAISNTLSPPFTFAK